MAKYDLYDKKLAGEKIRRWQLETGLQGREIAQRKGDRYFRPPFLRGRREKQS